MSSKNQGKLKQQINEASRTIEDIAQGMADDVWFAKDNSGKGTLFLETEIVNESISDAKKEFPPEQTFTEWADPSSPLGQQLISEWHKAGKPATGSLFGHLQYTKKLRDYEAVNAWFLKWFGSAGETP